MQIYIGLTVLKVFNLTKSEENVVKSVDFVGNWNYDLSLCLFRDLVPQ